MYQFNSKKSQNFQQILVILSKFIQKLNTTTQSKFKLGTKSYQDKYPKSLKSKTSKSASTPNLQTSTPSKPMLTSKSFKPLISAHKMSKIPKIPKTHKNLLNPHFKVKTPLTSTPSLSAHLVPSKPTCTHRPPIHSPTLHDYPQAYIFHTIKEKIRWVYKSIEDFDQITSEENLRNPVQKIYTDPEPKLYTKHKPPSPSSLSSTQIINAIYELFKKQNSLQRANRLKGRNIEQTKTTSFFDAPNHEEIAARPILKSDSAYYSEFLYEIHQLLLGFYENMQKSSMRECIQFLIVIQAWSPNANLNSYQFDGDGTASGKKVVRDRNRMHYYAQNEGDDVLSERHKSIMRKNAEKYMNVPQHFALFMIDQLKQGYLKEYFPDAHDGTLDQSEADLVGIYSTIFENIERRLLRAFKSMSQEYKKENYDTTEASERFTQQERINYEDAITILVSFSKAQEGSDLLYENLMDIILKNSSELKTSDLQQILNYFPHKLYSLSHKAQAAPQKTPLSRPSWPSKSAIEGKILLYHKLLCSKLLEKTSPAFLLSVKSSSFLVLFQGVCRYLCYLPSPYELPKPASQALFTNVTKIITNFLNVFMGKLQLQFQYQTHPNNIHQTEQDGKGKEKEVSFRIEHVLSFMELFVILNKNCEEVRKLQVCSMENVRFLCENVFSFCCKEEIDNLYVLTAFAWIFYSLGFGFYPRNDAVKDNLKGKAEGDVKEQETTGGMQDQGKNGKKRKESMVIPYFEKTICAILKQIPNNVDIDMQQNEYKHLLDQLQILEFVFMHSSPSIMKNLEIISTYFRRLEKRNS